MRTETLEQYSYGPYGSLSITGSTTNSYDYTGRESDGLGIDYYRARYYNPQTGRFLSEDPIGSINKYVYASNSPTMRADPTGLLDVYIWNYTGSGPDDNWGHASVMLDDGTYVSWWPGSNRTPANSDVYEADPLPADYSRDRQLEGMDRGHPEGIDPDEVIHIDGLDEHSIEKWWNKYKTTHKWKTISRNCSTTAADALMAGGAPPAYVPMWTPKDVLNYAKAVQSYENFIQWLEATF